MANQSKLKAWVRYDGTGRVISGGPIFQVNKPKVGNWKQIDANLCCNGGSTTTTTTSGGGSVTPTAWIINSATSPQYVCSGIPSWVVYTTQSSLGIGVILYYDAALTQPWTGNEYISYNGTVYNLSGATIVTNGTSC